MAKDRWKHWRPSSPWGASGTGAAVGLRRCLLWSNSYFLCPTWRKSHVYPLNNWNLTIPRSIRGEFLLLGTTHRFLLPALFKRMETGSFHSETSRKLRWGSHRHPKHLIQHISNRAAGTARLAGLGKWLSSCTQHCEPTPWGGCAQLGPLATRDTELIARAHTEKTPKLTSNPNDPMSHGNIAGPIFTLLRIIFF